MEHVASVAQTLDVANAVYRVPESLRDKSGFLCLSQLQSSTDGAQVSGQALVVRSDLGTDRFGHTFLQLTLRGVDRGLLEARWWRYPYPADRRPHIGEVYLFEGRIDRYNGTPQLTLANIRRAEDVDVAAFYPSTRRSREELCAELDTLLSTVAPDVAAVVRITLSGDLYERFCEWPAAQRHHGAVRHGLLAHSIRVAVMVEQLAAAYGPEGIAYDRDIAIAAALLHDVGKVDTLPSVVGASPSEEALRVDHVTRSVLLVRDAAFRAEPCIADERLAALLHAILAHHGRKEWGAPVEPLSVEAWLVHLADLAEARLWKWSTEEEHASVSS